MATVQSDARPEDRVTDVSVAACAVGQLSQAVKRRRGASRTNIRGEVVFRMIFFAAILMLPLAQTLAPEAVRDGEGSSYWEQPSERWACCCDSGRSRPWARTSPPC